MVDRADALWETAAEHDLAIVCTPNVYHVPLGAAALDAGLSVVVDKPLAASASQGRTLADLASARGLLLSVFQNRRWDGDFLTVRGLLEREELGPVVRFESRYERWRPGPSPGEWRERGAPQEAGGILFDLGSHHRISVMLQGRLVGTVNKEDVTVDEVLAIIILGKMPGEVTHEDLAELH